MSKVSSASEQTKRATEWPIKTRFRDWKHAQSTSLEDKAVVRVEKGGIVGAMRLGLVNGKQVGNVFLMILVDK